MMSHTEPEDEPGPIVVDVVRACGGAADATGKGDQVASSDEDAGIGAAIRALACLERERCGPAVLAPPAAFVGPAAGHAVAAGVRFWSEATEGAEAVIAEGELESALREVAAGHPGKQYPTNTLLASVHVPRYTVHRGTLHPDLSGWRLLHAGGHCAGGGGEPHGGAAVGGDGEAAGGGAHGRRARAVRSGAGRGLPRGTGDTG